MTRNLRSVAQHPIDLSIGVRVNVRIDIIDERTRRIRRQVRGHNLVVDSGLGVLALGLAGVSPQITHIGLGSNSTAVAPGQTALLSEIARPAITHVSGSGAVAMAQYYLGSADLNGSSIREAGLFVGATMLARFVFTEVDLLPKTNATAAVFTWFSTFSAV